MKPKVVGAFEAKTRLSELLDLVEKGAVYVITKRGRPVAELRPPARSGGFALWQRRRRIAMGADFDAPVPGFSEFRVKWLVDTHAFLWFMAGDARLSGPAAVPSKPVTRVVFQRRQHVGDGHQVEPGAAHPPAPASE